MQNKKTFGENRVFVFCIIFCVGELLWRGKERRDEDGFKRGRCQRNPA
jgi:hypothetical protein